MGTSVNLLYCIGMWPFCRKKKASRLEKLIAGIIIGGAIGSIVGKKLIEHIKEHDEEDKRAGDGEDFEESDEE